MTDEKAIIILNSLKQYYNDKNEDSYVGFDDEDNEALDMAIKSLRYKPIILHEHDAEPRRLRAILDTATEEIYVCRLTKQGADTLGMIIEEVARNDNTRCIK